MRKGREIERRREKEKKEERIGIYRVGRKERGKE